MSNDIPHRTRVIIRARSNGVCERCMKRPATDMAHRMPRDVGGHSPTNIAHLCRPCHQWSHDQPRQARATGWILPANSRIKTWQITDIPAQSRDGWVRFTFHKDPDGTYRTERIQVRDATAWEILALYGLLYQEEPA